MRYKGMWLVVSGTTLIKVRANQWSHHQGEGNGV